MTRQVWEREKAYSCGYGRNESSLCLNGPEVASMAIKHGNFQSLHTCTHRKEGYICICVFPMNPHFNLFPHYVLLYVVTIFRGILDDNQCFEIHCVPPFYYYLNVVEEIFHVYIYRNAMMTIILRNVLDYIDLYTYNTYPQKEVVILVFG